MKYSKEICLSIEQNDPIKGFTIIEIGEWMDEGKWFNKRNIFRDDSTDKVYALLSSRSGSYFTTWEYDSESWEDEVEVQEVTKKEVMTVEWV